MGLKSHFEMMAKYNQWFNGKIYDLASSLSEEILNKDQGAFFKSISGEPTISNYGLLCQPEVGFSDRAGHWLQPGQGSFGTTHAGTSI